jgi:hypothetical protein
LWIEVLTCLPATSEPRWRSAAPSVAWSVAAGALGLLAYSVPGAARWRAALWIAIAVLSHWILDVLVHRPEMPLAGVASPKLGFGLWDDIPVALAIESLIVIAGLALFLTGGGRTSCRRGRYARDGDRRAGDLVLHEGSRRQHHRAAVVETGARV